MSSRNQLIQRIDDLLALLRKGMYGLAQLVAGDRNPLQRMQNHWRTFESERWVEARKGNLVQLRLLHQRDYHPTLVAIEDGRLHHDYVGNCVAMRAPVTMDVELSHL